MNQSNEKQSPRPKTKKLVIIRGKGTPREQRLVTNIDLYWSEPHQQWMTIP